MLGSREDVGGAREGADLDFCYLIGMQVVVLDEVENCGDGRVRERFRGEELHAALRDAPGFAEAVGEDVQLPLGAEAVDQTFLAVDDVLGAGVALFGQQRCEHAALRSHRIDGVLHHGELAGGDCA